ncbi:MAG: immunity protein Imm33 domain-containing protein [Pontibacterium sp.]
MKSPEIDVPASTESETNQTKNGFLALVSKMVFEEKLPVRFMYKTVPEHLNDTGWRMFTGYETPEYLEDELSNLLPVAVEKMVELDATLTDLVEYNAGTVWERAPDSEGWERVYDYRIPAAQTEVAITNDVDNFKPGNEN